MGLKTSQVHSFFSGGFLYNPKTKKVLLHLRDDKTPINPNKWGFFGGLNGDVESPKECFIRELKEELGIDVKIAQVKSLCDYRNVEHNRWRYVFYVESNLKKSEMTLGEGAGFDWVSLSEAFKLDLTMKTSQDLETFRRFESKLSRG